MTTVGDVLVVVFGLLVLFVLYTAIRSGRDPLNRAAERAHETGDDEELRALIRLRYGPRDDA